MDWIVRVRHPPGMSTLAEIETAADALPAEQKQEILLFLAVRLREGQPQPQPRDFTKEEMDEWIRDDEEGMRRFREVR